MFDYEVSYSISIRRKFFDYKGEFPTGNTEVTVWSYKKYDDPNKIGESKMVDIDDICSICRLGRTLERFAAKYNVKIDVNKIWDEEIDFYNENNELFIHAFSKKHKVYVSELMPYSNHEHFKSRGSNIHQAIVIAKGDREYQSRIVEEREKAVLFSVPVFGKKWLPKSAIYKRDDFYCLKKYVANQWDFSEL